MMNTSFAYNSTTVNFGSFPGSQPSIASAAFSEDPSNRDQRDGYQYDYLTSGSGIGNVYINSKWLFKVSGVYELPFAFNVSAFYNARQGYPQEMLRPDPEPSQRRGPDRRPAEPGRRDASAELPEPRLPRRASDSFRGRPVHPVAGRVQHRQLEHDSGDPQPPERVERESDSGYRRAARPAVRRARELVSTSAR